MDDITRSADSTSYQQKVIYDAYSNLADTWMRGIYGDIHVEFSIEEIEDIREFERLAKEQGFTIGKL